MSQQQQMNMAAMGGPVGGGGAAGGQQMNVGTPNSSGGANGADPIKRLNTAIYDYLLRNSLYDVARQFISKMEIETDMKKSPNQRGGQANGADDAMDINSKEIQNRPDDLPAPQQLGDGPFLQDWWCQFWEIYHGQRGKGNKPTTLNYIGAQRQAQKARTNMMGQMDPAAMQNMRYNMNMGNGMANGMNMPKNMQGARPNLQQMAQLKNMQANQQNQMMSGNQMERSGSQLDANGPRSNSPGSGDAPSPKRQRLEGNMPMNQNRPGPQGQMPNNPVGPLPNPSPSSIAQTQELLRRQGVDPNLLHPQQLQNLANQPADRQSKSVETYSASMQQQMKAALNSNMNKGMPPNTNMAPGGQQGSPMSQAGMDGATGEFYAAAQGGRMPNAGGAGGPGGAQGNGNGNGNHALQDYQMQLMLLEQQNKKRLLMARQEQDTLASNPNGAPGPNGFPPGMSPSGGRGGDPSPNPNDMQRGTPKIGKAGMSPNGGGSPQPGMMNQGIPQQLREQMMTGQMRPPQTSHPMGGQMTPEQMRMLQAQQQGQGQMMPNGMWQGAQQGQGQMMPGQQPGPGGPPGQVHPNMTPRQGNQMGPPPPPQNGTQPSSPSQQPAAPPTPSQTNKSKPASKKESAKKAAANKKNAANAAAATTEADAPPTPTPATPITPMNQNFAGQKPGQQVPNGQGAPNQPQNANNPMGGNMQPSASMPEMGAPFGSLDGADSFPNMSLEFGDHDVLDNFDFDSFLNTADGDVGLTGFDANFAFGDPSIEAGGDMGN